MKKVIQVILIITIILMVSFTSIFVYQKFMKKEKKLEVDTTIGIKESDLNETIINQIDYYLTVLKGKNLSLLSNQDKLLFLNSLEKSPWSYEQDSEISGSVIYDNYTKSILGNIDFANENLICPIDGLVVYNYDQTTNTYKYNPAHGGHGGVDSKQVFINKLVSLVEVNEKYIATYKHLFGDSIFSLTNDNLNIYDDINNTNIVLTGKYVESEDEPYIEGVKLSKYIEDNPTVLDNTKDYIYTFEKKNNNIYLIDLEIQ